MHSIIIINDGIVYNVNYIIPNQNFIFSINMIYVEENPFNAARSIRVSGVNKKNRETSLFHLNTQRYQDYYF